MNPELRQDVIETLEWMIAYFEWQKQQTGCGGGDSLEIAKAKDVLNAVKNLS
jgi:hypothetical protein